MPPVYLGLPNAIRRARAAASRSRALRVSAAARSNSRARLVGAAELRRAGRRARSAAGGSPASAGSSTQRVDELEAGRRAERHRHRDRAVELDDRRRRELGERVVERGDARPVGLLGGARARVAGGDRGLQRVRARARRRAPRRARARRGRGGSAAGPSARGPGRAAAPARPSGRRARATRDAWISISATRPCTSGSSRRQLGEDAAEAQRVLAQRRPHPVVAGGGRVALVEDQVDDLEHRGQARARARRRAGTSNGTSRLGERALGAHDALRDRRLRDEERARDLLGREAAEQPQRQRDARLGREHRVAGGEDQPQQVVADVVVERRVEVGLDVAARPRARGRAPRACARAACARRSWSIARCLAVAISQAPGLSGTPARGHCSSAATSASCASSSARPTSRTMRARPAISLRRLDPPDRVDGARGVGPPARGYAPRSARGGSCDELARPPGPRRGSPPSRRPAGPRPRRRRR